MISALSLGALITGQQLKDRLADSLSAPLAVMYVAGLYDAEYGISVCGEGVTLEALSVGSMRVLSVASQKQLRQPARKLILEALEREFPCREKPPLL